VNRIAAALLLGLDRIDCGLRRSRRCAQARSDKGKSPSFRGNNVSGCAPALGATVSNEVRGAHRRRPGGGTLLRVGPLCAPPCRNIPTSCRIIQSSRRRWCRKCPQPESTDIWATVCNVWPPELSGLSGVDRWTKKRISGVPQLAGCTSSTTLGFRYQDHVGCCCFRFVVMD
jgi:hypothetical protein